MQSVSCGFMLYLRPC